MELKNNKFLEGFLDILEKKRTDPENYEWQDVADYWKANNQEGGANRDYIRNSSRFLFNFLDAGYKLVPPGEEDKDNVTSNCSYNGDSDTYTYDKLIEICEGEEITPEVVMRAHNIDPRKWSVVSYRNQRWHSAIKNGNKQVLYNSRLVVKPLKIQQVTYEDVEKYFKNKDFACKEPCPRFKYNNSDEYLHIDLTDSHIGLLSYNKETGEDYDVEIAIERIKTLFSDVVQRSAGRKFKRITIASLGDILHVDNFNNTTTKGTMQDTDGRVTKWFGEAMDMMIACIDKLLELESPIEYIHLVGNHDTITGSMLAMSLEKVYAKNPNITFDTRPMPQKAVVYGNTLVGLCHGDMPKKNMTSWLTKDYREEFGSTKFAQIHCGHLHDHSLLSENNILIYHLPAICSSSYWERKQGYRGERGMMCFIYNGETGLRDQWVSYV